ncbi:MAG: hypothetical protein J6W77_01125 [Prevotella sp.]|nr:hypothetical protein [Prevotella sp.]
MNNDFQNNMNEAQFEDMRQQMNILKKKLEQQEIMNERVIRNSMKKTVSSINLRYYIIMALCLFIIPYGYWAFVQISGLSLAFWIGTCILMLICAGATFYNGKDLRDSGLMRNNLIDVRKKVARAKKFDSNWLFFGIPMIILWFGWFVWEIDQKGLLIGGAVGGIIGLLIGLRIHYKTQRNYHEIIDQIEELSES